MYTKIKTAASLQHIWVTEKAIFKTNKNHVFNIAHKSTAKSMHVCVQYMHGSVYAFPQLVYDAWSQGLLIWPMKRTVPAERDKENSSQSKTAGVTKV